MTRLGAWARAAAAGALAAVALAGCGVASEDRPTTIDRDEVPFGLLREPPSTTPTTPTTPAP